MQYQACFTASNHTRQFITVNAIKGCWTNSIDPDQQAFADQDPHCFTKEAITHNQQNKHLYTCTCS